MASQFTIVRDHSGLYSVRCCCVPEHKISVGDNIIILERDGDIPGSPVQIDIHFVIQRLEILYLDTRVDGDG